jgi:predicted phage tail protein
MTKVTLHGSIGQAVKRKEWDLSVESPAEAIYAINCQSGDSIRKYFLKSENRFARYKVLVDGKEVSPSDGNPLNIDELVLKRGNIDNIDVVPVLEGAGSDNWMAYLGIGLGIMGLGFATNAYGAMIALSLVLYGAHTLLAQDPPMPETRQISNPSSDPTALANSYLFSGPANIINEGGPVPLGYGRLVVGSQVVMSSFDTKYVYVSEAGKVI